MLEMESSGFQNKLQVALSRVLELESHLGQHVFVESSNESKRVAGLGTQIAALECQVKTMTDGAVVREEAVDKIALIGRLVTVVQG